MNVPNKHLVFFDGKCGFCDRSVQFLLKTDKDKQFVFAPLQGKIAKGMLKDLPEEDRNEDTIILVENYQSASPKFTILGQAILRICWLLGGAWTLIGWLSFLPPFLYNWGYRLVAKNRKKLFCNISPTSPKIAPDRFLE